MPSRRGGNWCGVLGLLLVLAFVPAALAAQRGDGSSPAAAHQLTPGVPFHGTTAGATLDSWFNYNDFSQIALKAGDYLTVDSSVSWPPKTVGSRATLADVIEPPSKRLRKPTAPILPPGSHARNGDDS